MREMKDTDILYIGIVPDKWNKSKIGSIYVIRNVKVSDKDYPPLSVTMKGILPQLETAAKTNAHDDRKLVKKGDFVINSRSDRRGSCGISDRDGSVSLINLVLQPEINMDNSFYNWFFHTDTFAAEFYRWGHGIVDDLWTTTWQDMKNIEIIVPPLEEQKAIADFLDQKCGEIDEISGLIEKQIETLENYKKSVITETVTKGLNQEATLVDSGIQWIGEIPLGWDKLKVKDGFTRKKAKALQLDPVVLSLARSGVKIRDISTNEGQLAASYYEYNPVAIDDMLLNPMDLQSGANCSISKVEGVISPAYVNLRYKKGFNPRYYDYYFKIQYWSFAFFSYGKGVSFDNRWTLNEDTLMRLPLIVPPLEEQKAIADFLDQKCGEIDEIIADKKTQLENLSLYKKSLIYEYVTGKKEIAYE